ncbi:MAG: GntR family transcriptional regulator [Nostocoides sp.]
MTVPTSAQKTSSTGKLTRPSLRDGVYDAVLERLLSGELAPGQSLGIESVARSLGVSPSPVREALAQLESTGLVTRTALRGYTVADPLSAEQLAELMAARIVVEVAAVEGVFPVSDGLLKSLRSAHTAHTAAAERIVSALKGKTQALDLTLVRAYYEADQDFHLVLLENCGNQYLLDMAQSLSPHLHRMRQEYGAGRSDVEQATEEHSAVLAAVEAGDPAAASAAMREHLNAVRSRALSHSATPVGT